MKSRRPETFLGGVCVVVVHRMNNAPQKLVTLTQKSHRNVAVAKVAKNFFLTSGLFNGFVVKVHV